MTARHVRLSLIAAALVASPVLPAFASGNAASSNGVPTAGMIDRINGQIAILQGQLKVAKLKAAIKAAENGKSTAGSTPAPHAAPDAPPVPSENAGPAPVDTSRSSTGTQVNASSSPNLPTVNSVSSVGTHTSAVLEMPSGGSLIVHKGTQILSGYRVVKISIDGVELEHDGHDTWLPFTASGSSDQNEQAGSQEAVSSAPYVGPSLAPMPPAPGGQGN